MIFNNIHAKCLLGLTGMLLVVMSVVAANAQTFDSGSDGSDGSDGALELTVAGTYDFFDPGLFDPPLDPDGDGIYHFTTINIGKGVTLTMRSTTKGPVTWLASGTVQIAGTVDLRGEDGHGSGTEVQRRRSTPGAGGYSGGAGSRTNFPPEAGAGPGGGQPGSPITGGGGGGGYAQPGQAGGGDPNDGDGGMAYGNSYILPLIGGSGGGGTITNGGITGNGGGAGGGALLIVGSMSILIEGLIDARGGFGLNAGGGEFRGYGSGGAIRLVAMQLGGKGTLDARGIGSGSDGRIRLEAFQQSFSGSVDPEAFYSTPGLISIPAEQIPLRVVSVNGVPVPANPTGFFDPADVVINETGTSTLEIEGRGIPLGTVADVTMFIETGGTITVQSTPLAGTVALSTATAQISIPAGFVSFYVQANWTP